MLKSDQIGSDLGIYGSIRSIGQANAQWEELKWPQHFLHFCT